MLHEYVSYLSSGHGTSGHEDPAGMTIDELAAAAGTTTRRIRSLQTLGLLPHPELRGRTGVYGARHRHRLSAVLRLQDEGFSLESLRILLDALDAGRSLAAVLEIPGPPAATSGSSDPVSEPGTDSAELYGFAELQPSVGAAPTPATALGRAHHRVGRERGVLTRETAPERARRGVLGRVACRARAPSRSPGPVERGDPVRSGSRRHNPVRRCVAAALRDAQPRTARGRPARRRGGQPGAGGDRVRCRPRHHGLRPPGPRHQGRARRSGGLRARHRLGGRRRARRRHPRDGVARRHPGHPGGGLRPPGSGRSGRARARRRPCRLARHGGRGGACGAGRHARPRRPPRAGGGVRRTGRPPGALPGLRRRAARAGRCRAPRATRARAWRGPTVQATGWSTWTPPTANSSSRGVSAPSTSWAARPRPTTIPTSPIGPNDPVGGSACWRGSWTETGTRPPAP